MENIHYDYIIAGAGLTGISLAWLFSKTNKNILLIDRNKNIGGAYRFDFKDDLIVLHKPQIYSNAFIAFRDLLNDMDLDFYKLFQKSKHNILKELELSSYEKFIIMLNLVFYTFNTSYGKNISLHDFLIKHKFDQQSYNYIHNTCDVIFLADITQISLNQFLEFYNINYYYDFYHPKDFNNSHYISSMEKKLGTKNNIFIIKNADILKINQENNKITSITVLHNKINKVITCSNLILTQSPLTVYEILENSNDVQNAFMDINKFKDWTELNNTKNYYSLTIYFNKILDNKEIFKIRQNNNIPWNVSYTFYYYDNRKTILLLTIHKLDIPNENGNTVNQLNQKQISDYLLKYFDLPTPEKILVPDSIVRFNNKWVNSNGLYTITMNHDFIPPQSHIFSNLYYVGTHNGNHNYNITSIESSIQNSFMFAISQINDLQIKIKLKTIRKFNHIFYDILIIIFIFIILSSIKKIFYQNYNVKK